MQRWSGELEESPIGPQRKSTSYGTKSKSRTSEEFEGVYLFFKWHSDFISKWLRHLNFHQWTAVMLAILIRLLIMPRQWQDSFNLGIGRDGRLARPGDTMGKMGRF
jgi:hypothetical protein